MKHCTRCKKPLTKWQRKYCCSCAAWALSNAYTERVTPEIRYGDWKRYRNFILGYLKSDRASQEVV